LSSRTYPKRNDSSDKLGLSLASNSVLVEKTANAITKRVYRESSLDPLSVFIGQDTTKTGLFFSGQEPHFGQRFSRLERNTIDDASLTAH
jgi:hypothetical protein